MKSLILKNGANYLTALRVACTPIILFLTNNLFAKNSHQNIYKYFILLYIVICISDFIDGKIARKYGIESKFGATFDLFADFFFVVSMHSVLIIHNILPAWFLIVILDRFFNFIITSKIENDHASQEFKPKFDKIGKYVAVLMYIMPFLVFVDYSFLKSQFFATSMFLYCITGLSIMTSCFRIIHIKVILSAKMKGLNSK